MAPRLAALDILQAVRRGIPFEAALRQALNGLAEKDRRLAHQLAAEVLRHQSELDATLAELIPRGIASVKPVTLDLLRLGACQLHYLNRIPPHAAVSTAVDLARSPHGGGSSGFVNAVLRKVARLKPEELDARSDLLHLAELWSHPRWLVARWVDRFGLEATEELLRWNNTQPVLVLQPARISRQSLQQLWHHAGIDCFAAPWEAGLITGHTRPQELPGFSDGAFYVQDSAQALVLRYAGFGRMNVVYDACAAPGGKTLGLGREVGLVIAADRSRRRIKRLKENVQRAGSGREHPIVADASAPPIRPVSGFLLDAPCLGTGTFARHPDARLRVSPEALIDLAREQRRLLDVAASKVTSGGILCYATCSLEPEENQDQVEAFLHRHPEFSRCPDPSFPSELLNLEGDLLLLPQCHGTDGAYAARLVRNG